MTTLSAVRDQLGVWIPQVQGQYINMDWNPTNKGFGAQCWDLAAHWSTFLGLPVINTGGKGRWPGWAGNMVDAFPQTPAIAAAYTLHGPNETGQPGDIAVWGDSYWWYPATHVAVLYADKGSWLTCMSQNSTPSRADNPYPGDSSGPTTIQSLPREGLIGFIRPRTGGINFQSSTTPIQEDDMPFTFDDLKRAATEGALDALKFPFPNETGGKTSVEGMVSVFDKQRLEIIQLTTEAVLRGIFGTKFTRQGAGQSGETDLGSVLSWSDANFQHAGTATIGAAAGLEPDQVNAAIKAGIDAALAGTKATIELGVK